ncbi:MAG: hypothetical protein PWP07_1148 [Epulopiscium sp.]|jgi:hypothetical protein|uniref:Uncharacterized protein n=1 Tax=Defluviitalea raffinosedens TaxID=1450156 RepID=A0A7C8HF14_9FIRM|nr:hypothetical protein [Defluviitalea raffinosedens]MBZ4668013.1 hypothetical protein [Defluviitaleaceae bacterium]MDK2787923.1 hypothetical protein [Candidatus Epulonipiscium sp.]KAE9635422.1 hypothetical protein GND95_04545 [Defluviitalea raffinosedens]MBM7684325.1 hypothetical protein [Defluviitalea raffinosedens]HHW67601.1 hypothetical protein [Candidatus Epulonipiscium sp.]
MNHLNPNSYGLQDIPEPFRGQNNSFGNTPMNPSEPKTTAVKGTGRFALEDFLLILLLFLLITDYK